MKESSNGYIKLIVLTEAITDFKLMGPVILICLSSSEH